MDFGLTHPAASLRIRGNSQRESALAVKTTRSFFAVVIALGLCAGLMAQTVQSNIDPAHNFAWGENVGWINFRGEGTATNDALPPVVIGISAISGFAWGENIGWINFGDGTNADPNQHGVIVDSSGNLSGYAWGENVGWINFGTNFGAVDPGDRPHVDTGTGAMTGYAWGENIGWINLDGSGTGGASAQVIAMAPNAAQIADGIVGKTAIPFLSDRNADTFVNAADVVHRVENP